MPDTTNVHLGNRRRAPGFCNARLTLTLGAAGLAVGVCELAAGHDDDHAITITWTRDPTDRRPTHGWCVTCGRFPAVVKVSTTGAAICATCANQGVGL